LHSIFLKIMATFFKLPKNKRFSFKPRYYDEVAERHKEREELIKKELEDKKAGKLYRDEKVEMDKYITLTRRFKKKSNIRLLVILVLLLLIFYLFFYK